MLSYKTPFTQLRLHTTLIFFIVLLLSFVVSPIEVSANQPIRIYVNDRHLETDVAPILRNNRVFIPARAVANALNMSIRFSPEHRSLALWNNTLSISLHIGHDIVALMNPNGDMREMSLGTSVFIYHGRTMIPLRFVAENFGISVEWKAESRAIVISTPRPALPVRGTAYLPPTQPNPERRRMTREEVVALIEPATVQIQTLAHTESLRGSGFLVSPNGLVLTNAHVARGVQDLFVVFKTGERFPAQIIKINNMSDLALLRIITDTSLTFPYIKHRIYRSAVFAGDRVLSFGNPGSKRWFVSEGAVYRNADMTLAPAWTKDYSLIWHNAYTDVGSSGGAVVNFYGELIGVNALTAVYEEMGMAVPTDYLYELLDGAYFSLRCDWESYWTEMFRWQIEITRAKEAFGEGQTAQKGSADQANAWRKALAIMENIRILALNHATLFPELFHLPRLYVEKIDAKTAYYSYHVNTLDGRVFWTQEERNRLWSNVELAISEHNAEFQRVSAIIGYNNTHKAALP